LGSRNPALCQEIIHQKKTGRISGYPEKIQRLVVQYAVEDQLDKRDGQHAFPVISDIQIDKIQHKKSDGKRHKNPDKIFRLQGQKNTQKYQACQGKRFFHTDQTGKERQSDHHQAVVQRKTRFNRRED
jgi:hypothetical protein